MDLNDLNDIKVPEGEKIGNDNLYFVVSQSKAGEESFQLNDIFIEDKDNRCIKDDNGFYVQFGPYKTEEEAMKKLKEINNTLEEYSFENNLFEINKKSFD